MPRALTTVQSRTIEIRCTTITDIFVNTGAAKAGSLAVGGAADPILKDTLAGLISGSAEALGCRLLKGGAVDILRCRRPRRQLARVIRSRRIAARIIQTGPGIKNLAHERAV